MLIQLRCFVKLCSIITMLCNSFHYFRPLSLWLKTLKKEWKMLFNPKLRNRIRKYEQLNHAGRQLNIVIDYKFQSFDIVFTQQKEVRCFCVSVVLQEEIGTSSKNSYICVLVELFDQIFQSSKTSVLKFWCFDVIKDRSVP